jgi:hypothetical protein
MYMDSNPLNAKIEKRTQELQIFLNDFVSSWNSNKNHVQINCENEAAKKIASIYFEIINNNVKGEYFKNDGFVNRYKVASATEIACMLVKPLGINDERYKEQPADKVKINARLATTLAIQMLYSIHFKEEGDYPAPTENKRVLAAIGSHTYWVRYFDETKFHPVYLNSTFWEIYMAAILTEQGL